MTVVGFFQCKVEECPKSKRIGAVVPTLASFVEPGPRPTQPSALDPGRVQSWSLISAVRFLCETFGLLSTAVENIMEVGEYFLCCEF